MPDTTVKLQDITPVKSTFDNDDQLLLINPTGEARISKEDFLDAMPDDAITLIGDITTTGIEGDTVAKQLGALEKNSKATVIIDTASGAIANFPDGADDLVMHNVVAEINPAQSGSGDPSPSNIRPISGWTGCNVTRTGKNLLPNQKVQDTAYRVRLGESVVGDGNFFKAGTYRISYALTDGTSSQVPFWRTFKNGVNGAVNNSRIVTLTEDTIVKIWLYDSNGISVNSIAWAMLELGSTATTYEPYIASTTASISWQTEAGTVYGGTIDVATGLLTVDRAMVTMTGADVKFVGQESALWRIYTDALNDRFAGANVPYSISNKYSYVQAYTSINQINNSYGFSANIGQIFIHDDTFTSLDDIKASLNSSPLEIVYTLATPQTYQLTPQQLKTLLGTNNVWADTGNVSVTYPADTKMFIEKLTMPTEDDLVANQAITSGKYFMVGNSLYLALANIASGAQITIGTNAQRVSLADALNTINS